MVRRGPGGQQVGEVDRRRGHVLQVVEHDQLAPRAEDGAQPVGERPVAGLVHAQRPGERRQHEGRLGDGGQADDDGPVGEVRGHRVRGGEGEAGLADAAGTGQGQRGGHRRAAAARAPPPPRAPARRGACGAAAGTVAPWARTQQPWHLRAETCVATDDTPAGTPPPGRAVSLTRPPARGTARRSGRRPGGAAPGAGRPAARSGRRGGGSRAARRSSAPPPSGAAPAARSTRSRGGRCAG